MRTSGSGFSILRTERRRTVQLRVILVAAVMGYRSARLWYPSADNVCHCVWVKFSSARCALLFFSPFCLCKRSLQQRREREVRSLLEKLQPDMITVNKSSRVGVLDRAPRAVITEEKELAGAGRLPLSREAFEVWLLGAVL